MKIDPHLIDKGRKELAFSERIGITLQFIFKPYFNRVKLGEGGLVIMNLVHSVLSRRDFRVILAEFLLSFFVMCALYGFNDFLDRKADLINEKKQTTFTLSIIKYERWFLILNMSLMCLTVLFTVYLGDYTKTLTLCCLYVVNSLYSYKLKSIPIIDFVAVIVWGGLYVLLSGPFNIVLALIVGVMTGIAHLFQTMTDYAADTKNKVNTSIVAIPGREMLFLAVQCLFLGTLLNQAVSIWVGLSATLPFLLFYLSRSIVFSWYVSRMYFFICWLFLLFSIYGGF